MFLAKKEAIIFLPGSRRGFHSFLNSGRSKVRGKEGHFLFICTKVYCLPQTERLKLMLS